MIKVSVLYPYQEGSRFDMDYYSTTHKNLVIEKLGPACKQIAIEQGLAGGDPDSPPLYTAMGHLYFDSLATFQESFGPHAEAIMADVANYTEIQPVVQISEVKV